MLRPTPALLRVGLATILLSVIGCSRTTPADEARAENILLISNGAEPSSIDPHLCAGKSEGLIIASLWEPLTAWNESGTEIIPAAAASWEISPDGRTYTFHLRPESRWSNGDPVTSQDWVRSFQRWLTPSLGAPLAFFADSIVGVADFRAGRNSDPNSMGIRAPDDHTLVIEHLHPKVSFLVDISFFPWLPVHGPSLEAAGDPTSPTTQFTRPGELVTNGPFMLTDWKHDQYLRVDRNPHFRENPRLQGVKFLAMSDPSVQERAFRSGQLHITKEVPPTKIPVYLENNVPAFTSYQIAGTQFLSFNTQKPPLDNVKVRQALSLALDRQSLTAVVNRDGSKPAYSMASGFPGGFQPRNQIRESADEARKLLAEAGYPEGKGLPKIEFLYSGGQSAQGPQAIQQIWNAELGVEVELRNEEWKVFLDTTQNNQHQISFGGWLPLSPEPNDVYYPLLAGNPVNLSNWEHPEFNELSRMAGQTMDRSDRYEIYHKMDAIIRDEMPLAPLNYPVTSRLIHPSVSGWPANMAEGMVWTRIGFTD